MKLITNYKPKKNIRIDFLIFIFSCIGGYVVGAKLIENAYLSGNISKKDAQKMHCFCINGGAGFIIVAVGFTMYGLKSVGFLLYFSHILYSIIVFLILKRKININENKSSTSNSLSDIFCVSVAESSSTLLTVCSFVIAFSVINGYLAKIKYLSYLTYFTELTMALNNTRNLYFSAFLIGIGGISVFFQVLAISKNAGVKIKLFLSSLVLHGVFSSFVTFLLIKIFKISPSVFSSGGKVVLSMANSSISLSVSLIFTVLLLILSLEGKNRGGNLREDLLQ